MMRKFTRIALAAGVSGALVASAGAASAGQKTERALLGAVLGGVAGAALSKGDTGGAAIGAVAGAALGAATAKDNNRRYYSRSYQTSRPYYANDNRYYRTNDRYYGPDYRNNGYYGGYYR